MDVDAGSLVQSIAGRDKGGLFVVLQRESNILSLADGKVRRVENPKKKKLMHVKLTGQEIDTLKAKLASGETPTNAEIRKSLRVFYEKIKDESLGGFDHGEG